MSTIFVSISGERTLWVSRLLPSLGLADGMGVRTMIMDVNGVLRHQLSFHDLINRRA